MKTTNLVKLTVTALIVLITVNNISANQPSKNKWEKVKAYVNNFICYPSCNSDVNINGVVLVEYSVNTDGSLNIKGINASNQLLQDYVVNQFSKIEIKDTSFAEDTSFICKYIFIDEESLKENEELRFNEKPVFNYLAEY